MIDPNPDTNKTCTAGSVGCMNNTTDRRILDSHGNSTVNSSVVASTISQEFMFKLTLDDKFQESNFASEDGWRTDQVDADGNKIDQRTKISKT